LTAFFFAAGFVARFLAGMHLSPFSRTRADLSIDVGAEGNY